MNTEQNIINWNRHPLTPTLSPLGKGREGVICSFPALILRGGGERSETEGCLYRMLVGVLVGKIGRAHV